MPSSLLLWPDLSDACVAATYSTGGCGGGDDCGGGSGGGDGGGGGGGGGGGNVLDVNCLIQFVICLGTV